MFRNAFIGGNMKRCASLCIALAFAMLLSCSKDHSMDYALLVEKGAVQISVNLGKIGALQKGAQMNGPIEIADLCIALSAKDHGSIFDTIALAGGSQSISKQLTYANLAAWTENEAIQWTLSVESHDNQGKIVHSGDTVFALTPEDTINIPLVLKARYSILTAHFYPIRDSVTRCELVIDGNSAEAADSSFPKQKLIGDTVEVANEYLTASPSGVSHLITLNVYGVSKEMESILYKGDTTILVKSGEDKKYNVRLNYVGKDSLLAGLIMTATLGNIKGPTVEIPDSISEKLLLWNKLGSQDEVENSEFGPNGFLDNAEKELAFEPFYYGSGVRYPYNGAGMNKCKIAFDFSQSNFTTEQGCIEFWWKAGYTDKNPADTGYEAYRAFFSTADTTGHPPIPFREDKTSFLSMINNNWLPTSEDISFMIGILDTHQLMQGDTSSIKHAATLPAYKAFNENEVMHWACSYNVNGINNSDTTIIIYKNGVIIAATTATWPIAKIRSFWLGVHSYTVWYQSIRNLAYGPANGVYDNLKIWNYAKTDFSDRFSE